MVILMLANMKKKSVFGLHKTNVNEALYFCPSLMLLGVLHGPENTPFYLGHALLPSELKQSISSPHAVRGFAVQLCTRRLYHAELMHTSCGKWTRLAPTHSVLHILGVVHKLFPREKKKIPASLKLHGALASECYSSLFIRKVSRTFNCFAHSYYT